MLVVSTSPARRLITSFACGTTWRPVCVLSDAWFAVSAAVAAFEAISLIVAPIWLMAVTTWIVWSRCSWLLSCVDVALFETLSAAWLKAPLVSDTSFMVAWIFSIKPLKPLESWAISSLPLISIRWARSPSPSPRSVKRSAIWRIGLVMLFARRTPIAMKISATIAVVNNIFSAVASRSANTSFTGTTPTTNQSIEGTYKLETNISCPSNSVVTKLKWFLLSNWEASRPNNWLIEAWFLPCWRWIWISPSLLVRKT